MAHDMKWSKIQVLGKGSYGTVYLAITNRVGSAFSSPFSGLIAIKSAVFQKSLSLQNEAKFLQDLVDCPEINVHYFGNDLSVESGVGFYNLQLEYASGGTLEDLIKKTGGKLVEYDVQRYTRMIVKGLRCIHEKGYVHCDLKPANILVFRSKDGRGIAVKMADFGILKIPREENDFVKRKLCFQGTPIYICLQNLLH
ncbi:mitogen-activated protein kinase kinase kinase 20-like [Quercus robur]|uniref:mitogen-activated protein kinase kinase kinase 20-like n=1 Tax=Quercus robur TaxID=38942 RepID=UPI002161A46B|nr:mitogen-activated protein kinase kinase kinase 20-like [Quercus robur]